jgi:hypothetical protein
MVQRPAVDLLKLKDRPPLPIESMKRCKNMGDMDTKAGLKCPNTFEVSMQQGCKATKGRMHAQAGQAPCSEFASARVICTE